MRRTGLDNLLETAFRIRRGEARRVFLMFAYLMGVVSTFIVARNVRDTLFLSRADLSILPYMYVAVAGSVAPVSYAYSRFADRYRRDLVIRISLTAFMAVTLLFWTLLFLELGGRWIYPVLYIVVEIIGAISMIQFWTFANDVYSSREAKRLFGIIGAGGVLSNITCGFAITSIVPLIGSENLLIVCVLLLGMCVLAVRSIAKLARAELEESVHKPRKSRIGIAADSGTVLQSRHLKLIAAIIAVTFLTVSIVDYQFKVIAKSTYTETDLSAYFGKFYGYTGIISSFLQFFVTARLLERRGIVVSLALLPIGLLVGSGAMLLPMITPFAAATLAKAAENIFRYTINDASTQLLYVPVPSHFRGRAKAFIDGILKPLSIGVAGLVLAGLGRLIPAQQLAVDLAYVDLALVGTWIYLVLTIRREYVKSLIDTLHARRLDFSSVERSIDDETTIGLLRRSLRSTNETEVLHALELVPMVEADLREDLSALLGHPSKTVRLAVLEMLARIKPKNAEPIAALLRDPDPDLRAAAITAYCAAGGEDAIREATPYLGDPSPHVRAAAVIGLIENGGPDGTLIAADTLKSLLKSEDPELRVEGARVLGAIRLKSFYQPLHALLRDPEPRVRVAAVEAAGAMQSPDLVTPLIEALGVPETAGVAMRALAAHGPSIEDKLFAALANDALDAAIRRKLPKVIAQIGGQHAFDRLVAALQTTDSELRVAIARAASKIRDRNPHIRVDPAPLDAAMRHELRESYQLLAIIEDLGLAEDALLPDALRARHRMRIGIAFRMLEIRYPAKTIQTVYSNLDAESKAVRANALEVVDNVLSKEESRVLLPLLEDHTRAEKVQRGMSLFSLERHPPEQWLERLLAYPHPWIVACTLQLVGDRRLTALHAGVAIHLASTDPVVRETAFLTLARLLQSDGRTIDATPSKEDLLRLAKEASGDQAPEVRRASSSLLAALDS